MTATEAARLIGARPRTVQRCAKALGLGERDSTGRLVWLSPEDVKALTPRATRNRNGEHVTSETAAASVRCRKSRPVKDRA
jgi:hypothetical protein